jgi:hypothetical protein
MAGAGDVAGGDRRITGWAPVPHCVSRCRSTRRTVRSRRSRQGGPRATTATVIHLDNSSTSRAYRPNHHEFGEAGPGQLLSAGSRTDLWPAGRACVLLCLCERASACRRLRTCGFHRRKREVSERRHAPTQAKIISPSATSSTSTPDTILPTRERHAADRAAHRCWCGAKIHPLCTSRLVRFRKLAGLANMSCRLTGFDPVALIWPALALVLTTGVLNLAVNPYDRVIEQDRGRNDV